MRTDGTLQDWSIGPTLNPRWNSGESFSTNFQYGFTRLDQAITISGVPVPAGDYNTWFVSFMGQTSDNRPVVLSGNARHQRVYDGDISSVGGSLTLIPNANVSAVLRTCGWECTNPMCVDVLGYDFGACAAVLGWGVVGGACVAVSGCDPDPFVLFASSDECTAACPAHAVPVLGLPGGLALGLGLSCLAFAVSRRSTC